MEPRFAFTAQFWGNGGVVCRAVEDRPGPVVEQQFGQFSTWTQANACAVKLNEGLGLDPLDVREIVTSSFLATACVLQAALAANRSWSNSAVRLATRAAHRNFLLAELSLALTFCRSARQLATENTGHLLRHVQNAIVHARQFMALFGGDASELKDISASLTAVNAALLAPALQPTSQ
ncbi:MAG: hypothetical protein DMG36_19500 [Acidobacteria bacterium]|nr:MAG: hypothetical protein DMG36_19500 [Acidobacteriota bacterium]